MKDLDLALKLRGIVALLKAIADSSMDVADLDIALYLISSLLEECYREV